jgi:stalled ribosome alternative rescue factor ArfA
MPGGEEEMRNPIAKQVRTPAFRPRVVKPLKGKGSYNRKDKKNG